MPFSLNLYAPLITDPTPAPIADISQITTGWRRSIRLFGGCWIGSFRITANADNGLKPNDLGDMFHTWLGGHLEEMVGGVKSWAGMIYSIDLNHNGDLKRRSLDNMYNAVMTTYINTSDAVTETTWALDARSIARYGRREETLSLDYHTQSAAEAARATWLMENGMPWPRTVDLSKGKFATMITVKLCGYSFPCNWRFVTSADTLEGPVDEWISAIATTDCADFVTLGRIEANSSVTAKREIKTPVRAWDKMEELAGLGDSSGNPWILSVDEERRLNYRQFDPSYRYLWSAGQIKELDGHAAIPWFIKPGVIRDVDYPVSTTEDPGTLLPDSRDAIITEVEATADGAVLKTENLLESDILAAQQAYAREIERGKEVEKERNRPWYDNPEWEGDPTMQDIFIPRLPRGERPNY